LIEVGQMIILMMMCLCCIYRSCFLSFSLSFAIFSVAILSVFMNRSLEEVSQAAFNAQNSWLAGNQSRFELVDYFFDELVPQQYHVDLTNSGHGDQDDDNDERQTSLSSSSSALSSFLPRIKVLVTTVSDGFRVEEAQNRQHLKELIIKTTWVPYLTGWGFLSDDDNDHDNGNHNEIKKYYLDGGFSRMLHPPCEVSLHLPLIWETLVHTFSPGLTPNQVNTLWLAGHTYDSYNLRSSPSSSSSSSSPKSMRNNNNSASGSSNLH
jgi:hypothetical protein